MTEEGGVRNFGGNRHENGIGKLGGNSRDLISQRRFEKMGRREREKYFHCPVKLRTRVINNSAF